MAQVAFDDGISTIVASPHVREINKPSPDQIRLAVAELNGRLRDAALGVTIVPGAEFHLLQDPQSLEGGTLQGYAINNSRYVLVEMPFGYVPSTIDAMLFRIVGSGLWPILCHPERNQAVVRQPQRLIALLSPAVGVQITADSLLGVFGPEVQQCALFLLQNNAVSCIASDGHASQRRRPILTGGVEVAAGIIGGQRARRLVVDNPAAVLANAPLPLLG